MRRIALAAALAATLTGGAAALAATPESGTPGAPLPDPYQGAWQLVLDGKIVGPVLNVDGCDLKAPVVVSQPGNAKHVGPVAAEPCTFDAGAGMSPTFIAWLDAALTGNVTAHDAQLVRTDARPGYALDLPHATVAAVSLPKVDRGATAPVLLHVSLASDLVRRVAASASVPARPRPLVPASLSVTVAGQPVATTSVGPWTGAVKTAESPVGRDAVIVPHTVDVGDLPIRVAESTGKAAQGADVAGWAQGVLVDGKIDERPVTVSVSGLTLTLGNAGPDRADLAARADGSRGYDLYAETAGLASGK
jgi:hypothetical protein